MQLKPEPQMASHFAHFLSIFCSPLLAKQEALQNSSGPCQPDIEASLWQGLQSRLGFAQGRTCGLWLEAKCHSVSSNSIG